MTTLGLILLAVAALSALFVLVEPTSPPTRKPRPPLSPDESGAVLDTDAY